nr:hypothetical protein [Candidatus Koribacter versatilis]
MLEREFHDFGIFGMHFDGSKYLIVPITERGTSRINALLGFFAHSLNDFFAQVIGIKLRGNDLDAVHEFRLRFRVFRMHGAGFYEVNLRAEFFKQAQVVEVATETVHLLYQ